MKISRSAACPALTFACAAAELDATGSLVALHASNALSLTVGAF
jgi:hypothetical protein